MKIFERGLLRIRLWSLLLSVGLISFFSCQKKDDLSGAIYNLGGDTVAKTPLDDWLYTNFTHPYNIDVKYRWDGSELDQAFTVVPPYPDSVMPMMNMVNELYIKPYASLGGLQFFRTFCPKLIYLVGSFQYNSNSTITLGLGEAGVKIELFGLNLFDQRDTIALRSQAGALHVIHHEFGHILNQNIPIPSQYQQITAGSYTASWQTVANGDQVRALEIADSLGFITPYSRANYMEDFVEMLSTIVANYSYYNKLVNNIGNFTIDYKNPTIIKLPSGKDSLIFNNYVFTPNTLGQGYIRQKEQIIHDYMIQNYHIDIYQLAHKIDSSVAIFSHP